MLSVRPVHSHTLKTKISIHPSILMTRYIEIALTKVASDDCDLSSHRGGLWDR